MSKCGLCGEPMPAGEEMFKFHGYSGPCPKPPLPPKPSQVRMVWVHREGGENDPLAKVVIKVEDEHGQLHTLGEELVSANFSSSWHFPQWFNRGDGVPSSPEKGE